MLWDSSVILDNIHKAAWMSSDCIDNTVWHCWKKWAIILCFSATRMKSAQRKLTNHALQGKCVVVHLLLYWVTRSGGKKEKYTERSKASARALMGLRSWAELLSRFESFTCLTLINSARRNVHRDVQRRQKWPQNYKLSHDDNKLTSNPQKNRVRVCSMCVFEHQVFLSRCQATVFQKQIFGVARTRLDVMAIDFIFSFPGLAECSWCRLNSFNVMQWCPVVITDVCKAARVRL